MKRRKAIVLARVSTETQTLDEQKKALYEIAMKDGYSPDQIRYITHEVDDVEADEGEDDLGLREMRNALMTDEYGAVYVWDISQIACTKKMLFAIVDYLLKRKIHLVVASCDLRLLNRDGTVDNVADMSFTMRAHEALKAMYHKKAGVGRGKKPKTSEEKKAELERKIAENTELLAVIDAKLDDVAYARKEAPSMLSDEAYSYWWPLLSEKRKTLEGNKKFLELENKKYQELLAAQ